MAAGTIKGDGGSIKPAPLPRSDNGVQGFGLTLLIAIMPASAPEMVNRDHE